MTGEAVWGFQMSGSKLRSIFRDFRYQGVIWGSILGRVQVPENLWGAFRYHGVICRGGVWGP